MMNKGKVHFFAKNNKKWMHIYLQKIKTCIYYFFSNGTMVSGSQMQCQAHIDFSSSSVVVPRYRIDSQKAGGSFVNGQQVVMALVFY